MGCGVEGVGGKDRETLGGKRYLCWQAIRASIEASRIQNPKEEPLEKRKRARNVRCFIVVLMLALIARVGRIFFVSACAHMKVASRLSLFLSGKCPGRKIVSSCVPLVCLKTRCPCAELAVGRFNR